MDLNQRRLSPTDLQSVAIDRSAIPPLRTGLIGAGGRIRTCDLLITSQPLYQVSYTGKTEALMKKPLNLAQYGHALYRQPGLLSSEVAPPKSTGTQSAGKVKGQAEEKF